MMWHRLTAFFVLLTFAPVAALAGTPLRHCIGADGHSALEFVVPGAHHDHDDAAVHDEPASLDALRLPTRDADQILSEFVASPVGADCLDMALMGAGHETSRTEIVRLYVASQLPEFRIPDLDPLSAQSRSAAEAYDRRAPVPTKTGDLQIATRRTVVLLI